MATPIIAEIFVLIPPTHWYTVVQWTSLMPCGCAMLHLGSFPPTHITYQLPYSVKFSNGANLYEAKVNKPVNDDDSSPTTEIQMSSYVVPSNRCRQ